MRVPWDTCWLVMSTKPHLSVVELAHDEVHFGEFDVAAPVGGLYASPNHRFGFALARGEGDNDDRVHVFERGDISRSSWRS